MQATTSRQHRWQLARIAEGRCAQCGKPRRYSTWRCERCAMAARRRNRERLGLSPWHPGGPGRPPLHRKAQAETRREAAPER